MTDVHRIIEFTIGVDVLCAAVVIVMMWVRQRQGLPLREGPWILGAILVFVALILSHW